jgi:glycosyltransferase involved in cell wall biosynthesis
MTKRRILQITKSGGGVGQYVFNLTEALTEQGFHVQVVCLSEGHLIQKLEERSIPYTTIPMERYRLDPLSDVRTFIRLRDVVSRGRFDLVHAHTSKPGFLGRLAAKMSGLPVIFTPHCFSFHNRVSRGRRLLYLMLERLVGRCLTDLIITVADWERQLALQAGVVPVDKVITVHTGIPLSPYAMTVDCARVRRELGARADSFLVGMVARLEPPKSPQDAVRAIAQVEDNVQLLLVGDGLLKDDVQRLIGSLGFGDRVLLAGWLSDVPTVLHCLDAFLLSSYWEGFSLTVLEAMACGLPVVATDINGTREKVQNWVTGYLVPPGKPEALGEAIQRLAADRSHARMMGQAGRERLKEEFGLERMVSCISQAYETLIQENLAYQDIAAGSLYENDP